MAPLSGDWVGMGMGIGPELSSISIGPEIRVVPDAVGAGRVRRWTTMSSPAPYAAARPEPLYPRLRRSRSLRVVAGVASGLAQHLQIPVLWVRVFFVIASFAGGLGPLLYAGLWMLTPLEEKQAEKSNVEKRSALNIVLVAVGFVGALVALQVTSGVGGTVVFVLGLLIVGAVIALQAYDRGTGSVANYAALAVGVLLVMGGVLAIALMGRTPGLRAWW
ncbi:PspC domain-containing protein [Corynebacterium aquatimens]|uniref:PspC domain-containing protein n=1 Tax=Corynebacterium aquatimens TaxID=1190508 RepID=UPI0033136CF6